MPTTQKQVNIPMTDEQVNALKEEAKRRGLDVTSLVRMILHGSVADYPDNMPKKGKYPRQK